MKYNTLILLAVLLFSCNAHKKITPSHIGIPSDFKPIRALSLVIDADSVVSDTLCIKCAFINKSNMNVAILDYRNFDPLFRFTCWSIDIINLENGRKKVLPHKGFHDWLPNSNDFQVIRYNGGECRVDFKIDFKDLIDYYVYLNILYPEKIKFIKQHNSHLKIPNHKESKVLYKEKNKLYGKYAIRVYYWYPTYIHCLALNSFYCSNEIIVEYRAPE